MTGRPADPAALPGAVRQAVVDPAGPAFARLATVMARLRGPDGCPWDRQQTHASLARYLLEETAELLDAIDAGEPGALREELGDVLLQVVFHAQIAYESGDFAIAGVVDDLVDKLVRRHPHVFGDLDLRTADEVVANWDRIKQAEKPAATAADPPRHLPALARAAALLRRLQRSGVPRDDDDTLARRIREAAARVSRATADGRTSRLETADGRTSRLETADGRTSRLEVDVGELLMAAAELSQRAGVDPETALRRSAARLAALADAAAEAAQADGVALESLSPARRREYWDRASDTDTDAEDEPIT